MSQMVSIDGGYSVSVNEKTDVRVAHPDKANSLTYGVQCAFEGCMLDTSGGLVVGNRVWILDGAKVLTHSHPYENRHDTLYWGMEIGDDVIINDNSIILPQVRRIGKGAIIGAGAVVTKEVPAGVLVAGNPAKIRKYYKNELDKH